MREDELTVGAFPAWFRRWGIGAWLVLGMAGLILAAPLVSAGVNVHDDLARLRTPADAPSSA